MRSETCAFGVCVEGLEERRLMSVGTVEPRQVVRMETSLGRITVELTPDVTPLTVQNFLSNYVDNKLYDNTIVHRSVPGFVIQAGGYKATGSYSHIDEAIPLLNEFQEAQVAAGGGAVNVRGTIAMAKLGEDPDSATSEWFINLADNASNLDYQNGGFTVFGRVIGGGMHTVDAIAGLEVVNASGVNKNFTELPIVETSQGPAAVVVTSVRSMDELSVRLDGTTKKVMWVDERGGHATITLSKGTADLNFVGSGLKVTEAKGVVTVSGTGVELADVAAQGTDKSSVLAISSRGGKGPARVGDISADGALGRIDAKSVVLEGDLTVAKAVGRIDLGQSNGSVITVGGAGAMALKVGTATDTSVKTTMSLKEMTVKKWTDDGLLPTSVEAAGVGRMTVAGNFSSNLVSSGAVGTVVVNGNVGTLGASTWNVTGKVGEVRARGVKNLTVNAGSINAVKVSGAVESSTVSATGSIGSVSAAGMKASTLHAGASVGKVTLKTFSSSTITSPTVGTVRLGKVTTANGGTSFGVEAKNVVTRLDAVVGGKAVSMRGVKTDEAAQAYFAAKKVDPGDFSVSFI